MESRILVRDTWNTAILSDLAPEPGDVVINKNRYSGFYKTELESVLKRLGVSHLVVTGCTTSVCVDSTIRDAMFRDYRCLLLTDCTAEPQGDGKANYDASLLIVRTLLGWTSTSSDFIGALNVQGDPSNHDLQARQE